MTDTVWLTYDELADRLGIARESARQHVKRKRWARQRGNDGRTRIGVSVEHLENRDTPETAAGSDSGHASEHDPAHEPAQSPGHDPGVSEVLTRHIERLEQQLDAALTRVSDRDAVVAERDVLAVQLDALRAALIAAETDRDRWHEMATRVPEPTTNRHWWRRLVG